MVTLDEALAHLKMAANTIVLIDAQRKVLYEETLEETLKEGEAKETEIQNKDFGNVEV